MVMGMVKSMLKRSRVVDHAAWSGGELLHRRVPRAFERRSEESESRVGEPTATACTPAACPSQPHPETDTDPVTPRSPPGVENPVLTAEDVTDYGPVDFVADPFLYPDGDRWHMFFEVYTEARDPDAVIGHATSLNAVEWEYDRVVLDTGSHLSFPYVFR